MGCDRAVTAVTAKPSARVTLRRYRCPRHRCRWPFAARNGTPSTVRRPTSIAVCCRPHMSTDCRGCEHFHFDIYIYYIRIGNNTHTHTHRCIILVRSSCRKRLATGCTSAVLSHRPATGRHSPIRMLVPVIPRMRSATMR